jgi:hypothetical protein
MSKELSVVRHAMICAANLLIRSLTKISSFAISSIFGATKLQRQLFEKKTRIYTNSRNKKRLLYAE